MRAADETAADGALIGIHAEKQRAEHFDGAADGGRVPGEVGGSHVDHVEARPRIKRPYVRPESIAVHVGRDGHEGGGSGAGGCDSDLHHLHAFVVRGSADDADAIVPFQGDLPPAQGGRGSGCGDGFATDLEAGDLYDGSLRVGEGGECRGVDDAHFARRRCAEYGTAGRTAEGDGEGFVGLYQGVVGDRDDDVFAEVARSKDERAAGRCVVERGGRADAGGVAHVDRVE